jgi:glycosyltransferase involved in cell wall biosynthesis
MRVLCVCDEDMRKEEGTKVVVIEVAQNLKKLGVNVLIISPGYSPRDKRQYGLDIHYVPTFKKNVFSYLIYEFLKVFYLIFISLKYRPDIVYSMSGVIIPTTPVVAYLLRVPHMIQVHGIMEDEFRRRGINKIVIRLVNIAQRVAYRLSSSIICVTEGISFEIARRNMARKEKLFVLPNGANLEHFRPLDKLECRQKIGLDKDTFYVVFVGSFAPWQGLETLANAAKQVKEKGYTNIKYLLVGDGEVAPILKQMVHKLQLENDILFAGRVPHENVTCYINAADVAVAPFSGKGTQALGSPLKLFEYLACGKPVISTRTDGVTEIVEGCECGYLAEIGNSAELATAIIRSFNDHSKLEELGERGRKFVEAEYSWSVITQRLLQHIENVIQRKKNVKSH